MSNKYLLPCRCGQQHVVEPRRAGETIDCSCGANLHIPTMLEMAALEPAPEVSVAPTAGPTWNWQHRLITLGIVFCLIAVVAVVWLYRTRPIQPIDLVNPEQIRESAQKLPPARTWQIWEAMKQGIGYTDQRYAAQVDRFHIWSGVTVVVALLGLAFIFMGAWSKPSNKGVRRGTSDARH